MANALDATGVHEEWDADQGLRELLRDGKPFLEAPACADISTCIVHEALLGPLLTRMSVTNNRDLPQIDQLKFELEALLKKNKQGVELAFIDISKKAWAIKKLCGFVKAKARRREVSTASGLRLQTKT